jgi:two-component system, NarL family, response regulator NreC
VHVNDASANADETIRVLIADDHALVRTGLCMILEDEPGMEVVGEAADGAEALELALELRPSVVLADVSMPPPDGIELARLLRRKLPATKTIIVTMHEDDEVARDALAAGAAGYVIKRSGPQELTRAIRQVMAGEIYLAENMRPRLTPPAPCTGN